MRKNERVGLGCPDWSATLYQLARHKFVRELMLSTDDVLYPACGYGYLSKLLAEKVLGVYAFDKDKKVIDYNDKNYRGNNIRYAVCNVWNFDTDEKFDVIMSFDFIEHLSKSDGIRFIDKYYQYLVDDGMFIIGTPRKGSNKTENRLKNHKCEYSVEDLERLLGRLFNRFMIFTQTDEIVGTQCSILAWNLIGIGLYPKWGVWND